MPIRILIADDHDIVRSGLRMILESQDDMTVVGEARNGTEAITQAETLLPDVLLMDISMPEINGIDVTRLLRERSPSVKVIILSMHHTIEFICQAKQAGAKAYVMKESAGSEVRKAVRSVMKGRTYVMDDECESLTMKYSEKTVQSPLNSLSSREREIMNLVVDGKTSAAIAAYLNISPKSVETYRSRLMQKLGVGNVAALVKFALLHGVISLQ